MVRLFDHRFDAFAAATHENLPPRAAVALGAGLVALTLLPWPVCAGWAASALSIEVWGWFASRRQHLGQPVNRVDQVCYLANLIWLIVAWFALALMLWRTGRADGAVGATIIWISIIGFAQTFGSRTPLGFAVCGVLPASGALTVMMSEPIHGMDRVAVAGIMTLALGFAVAGARQTFLAGRRHEETQARLADSEAESRVLADHIADVIGRLGVDGRWRYISPSIEATLGYTAAEFRALTAPEFIHPDDIDAVLHLVDALSEVGGAATLEYRQIAKDGSFVWCETSFTVILDPATGDPLEVICLTRDISTRKALELDLVEARERAEAAAAAKADFLANMTHELRTPLNAIIGFSGVLRDSGQLSRRDARHAQLISEASGALLVVVNDVLDFSKLESGAFELDPQPFDPLALARSVIGLVQDLAHARGLKLQVIGEPGALLSGDGPRLRQVLLNLVSNALKFTHDGGVTVRVADRVIAGDLRRLRVEVSDTGIGIAADKQSAVFERFNQADVSVSRRFGGTGLGLAICKRIIELMGGRIGVASREGEGSTFWFELDLPKADNAATAGEQTVRPGGVERPIRLLLVEDLDVNRELVRVILEPFDIAIDTATNGAEALEAVQLAAYDLVLMDMQMPVMDGLTAAARIRALPDPRFKDLPIVAMTANVLPDQVQRCLAAGMNAHLGKPISPGDLLDAIATWTAGQAAADAAALTLA